MEDRSEVCSPSFFCVNALTIFKLSSTPERHTKEHLLIDEREKKMRVYLSILVKHYIS